MQKSVPTQREEAGNSTRPATAGNLKLRAYRRPYDTGKAQVLTLLASGEYSNAPYTMFFQGTPGDPNTYTLMETVPSITFGVVNYPAVCHSSDYGLPELADTITIISASGEHKVPVQALD